MKPETVLAFFAGMILVAATVNESEKNNQLEVNEEINRLKAEIKKLKKLKTK